MGWASQRVAAINEAEQRLLENRRWKLHVAEILPRKSLLFFDGLAERIASDVREFNEALGRSEIEFSRDGEDIFIDKKVYPTVHVKLRFNPSLGCVEMYRRRVEHSLSEGRSETTATLPFELDSQDEVWLAKGDLDGVAKTILEPVFAAFSPTL